jgi:integrase
MARNDIILRGRKWYLRLAVPRSLRHLFLSSKGKPMAHVVEPLSDSYEVAKVKAAQRTAVCVGVFARIRAGEKLTPAQVKTLLHPRGPDEPPEAAEVDEAMRRLTELRRASWFTDYAEAVRSALGTGAEQPVIQNTGETVSRAAEAWFSEMTRDKSAAPRSTTLDGHRVRVRAFVKHSGDVALSAVTRAMASDFLASLKVSNRTRNNYAQTLASVFESAKQRGRFTGDSPFGDQKAKVARSSYAPFTVAELQALFGAMPRDVAPKKHTPETALPWVALIAAYTGMRLEEIAQLSTADIREENANGATVTVIDIHNGGTNNLKNDSAPRLVPVHSALVRAGLLDYVAGLKAGPLFPGLSRRASKGGKVGARLGELFRKRLVALGIKRDGLCFHSFRHTVAGRLDAAGVSQSDVARILGHAVAGMSYGTYSQAGPGLKRVAAVVEQITYEGLRP